MSSYMSWVAANAPPTQHSDVSMEDLAYYENLGHTLNVQPNSASIARAAINDRIESLPAVISIPEPIAETAPVYHTRSRTKAKAPNVVVAPKETKASKAKTEKASKAAKAANARAAADAERVRLALKFEKILTSGTFVDDDAREAYLLSVFDGELPEELTGLTDYDLITAATEMIVNKIMDGEVQESNISDMTGGANNNYRNYRNRRPPPINTNLNRNNNYRSRRPPAINTAFNPRNTNNARPNNLDVLALNAPVTPRRRTRRNSPPNVRANRGSLLRRRRSISNNEMRQPDFSVEERVLPRGATDAITWELIKDGEEMVDIKMTDTYNSELEEPLYYTYETYRGLHGKHPQSRRPIAASARFYTARIPPENVSSSYGSNTNNTNNVSNTVSTRRHSRRTSRRPSTVNTNMNGGSKRTRKNRKHK